MVNAKEVLEKIRRSVTKKERNVLIKHYPLLSSLDKEELLNVCLSLIDAQDLENAIDNQEEKPIVLTSMVYGLPDPTDPDSYLDQIPEIHAVKKYRGTIILSDGTNKRPSGRGRPNGESIAIEELAKIHNVFLETKEDEESFAEAIFEGKDWIKKETIENLEDNS